MNKCILILLALSFTMVLNAQMKVKIESVSNAEPGTIIHVPVSVSGFDGTTSGIPVSGLQIYINYPGNSLLYDTTLSFTPIMPASQWFFGTTGSEYATNWIEPNLQVLNIPDNTILFEVAFEYLGGTSSLEFLTSKCEILDAAYAKIEGVIYENGQVTPSAGSGVSEWTGDGNWNNPDNWSNGIPGESTKAVIQSGSLVIEANAVAKSLEITSDGFLVVQSNATLTVDSSFINNGSFRIDSDFSGTGSVIVNGSVSGNGNFHTELFLDHTDGKKHFISPPVESVQSSALPAIIEKFDEPESIWSPVTGSVPLESGTGYRTSGESETTLDFTGPFFSADKVISDLSFSSTVSGKNKGLNLVGNPFSSAISWNSGDWVKTNLDGAMYCWHEYKYICSNGVIGSLQDGIIPAMQGFFVRANSADASLTIPADSRLHSSEPVYRNNLEPLNLLSLQIENSNDALHYDETFIHINSPSTNNFDSQSDAYKYFGNDIYPQIYTLALDNSELSINTQPAFQSIPVVCKVSQPGSYKIKFSNQGSFPLDQPLAFEDKAASLVVNLRYTDNYIFITDGPVQDDRFFLHFYEVGIDESRSGSFTVYPKDGKLFISTDKGIQMIDRVIVYNVQGQVISDQFLVRAGAAMSLPPNVVPGIYFVKLIAGSASSSCKLFINDSH